MGVKKIRIQNAVLKLKDNITEVLGVDHTLGKVAQSVSGGIYGSGRGSETDFYNISNGFDILLRLWFLGAKQDKVCVVGCLIRSYCFSEGMLSGHQFWNVILQVLFSTPQNEQKDGTAWCIL